MKCFALDKFGIVRLLYLFVMNNMFCGLDRIKTKPGRNEPVGLVFVCCCSSQRSNRRTLFHYFSINTDCLFALAG